MKYEIELVEDKDDIIADLDLLIETLTTFKKAFKKAKEINGEDKDE